MPRLEEVANVVLRVPSILVLDMLYKCDIDSFTDHLKARTEDMLFKYKYVLWNIYYLGHVVSVVVLLLPLGHIIQLYLHVLCALLLYMAHQIVRDYVRGEAQYGYGGAVFLDSPALNRFVTALTSQIIISTLCAFLMRTRRLWLFSAHLLPLLARVFSVPLDWLLTLSSVSMMITAAEVAVFLLVNLFVPYRLARATYREIMEIEVTELYRLMAVGVSLWHGFAVPVLFSVFWFVLFGVQLITNFGTTIQQGPLLYLLTSVSECCASPYSLLGLTFVVSYTALGLLSLCKFYLGGFNALQNHNVMHRGVTEGVTLLLLALQTGLLDMAALQRCFLLFIILFIVLTSTLQSMSEITEPVVLGLGASRNRCVWKHLRGLSMCGFLLLFPGFMAYKISQFFNMDFWLLILVSSCMLTSLQVTGTLLIYSLFMVEVWRGAALPGLDEIVYYVNGVCRVLEFAVAVCVVAYGAWESLWGEWSWMGASVIIIHSYCNVWLRAQAGWRSFLLRQEAARKINVLPRANAEQLRDHNDVCAICFQDMTSAVITYCGHFFHGNCLRKWLYVQETCPMCHTSIKPSSNPTAHPNPPPSEQQEEEQEEQGSQGDDDVCPPESDRKYSNSQSPQHLHCGANGDSQSVDNPVPSCSSDGDLQELREAD
ncbi:RING finger protein 145 [Ctenopharyngodon idella]|uniref:RING finger protein 145 n=1 Tax=Ctenopharyngodon idella TaxID=7959 RepID=UPI0022316B25|nr:RING finger protein 145 [Ctenopharyngodon idella]XP_051773181.1 RING finger protein 145 [Ctenopharyngodon idella]XP_051773182.1 RING finger protein 145 [Ctenopharyngodon idella]XP_051773183.1 RING finger protein 145 [Ctenopharyngodon idella]